MKPHPDELERLGNEATEAPWAAFQDRDYNCVSSLGAVRRVIYGMPRNDGTEMIATDKFIAAARNHWNSLVRDYRLLRDVAVRLGWTLPSDDGFWYRDDHGPVHDDDVWPFILEEIQELAKRSRELS